MQSGSTSDARHPNFVMSNLTGYNEPKGKHNTTERKYLAKIEGGCRVLRTIGAQEYHGDGGSSALPSTVTQLAQIRHSLFGSNI